MLRPSPKKRSISIKYLHRLTMTRSSSQNSCWVKYIFAGFYISL
jgi:hypothetical protein